eukprot:28304-Eustigmatos_ZCMA.PRE.1
MTTCMLVVRAVTVVVLLVMAVYFVLVWGSGAARETRAMFMYIISTAHHNYPQPLFVSIPKYTTTALRLANQTIFDATTTAAHT